MSSLHSFTKNVLTTQYQSKFSMSQVDQCVTENEILEKNVNKSMFS